MIFRKLMQTSSLAIGFKRTFESTFAMINSTSVFSGTFQGLQNEYEHENFGME